MKKVLITGASGFIGKHVLEVASKEKDVEVYAVDRKNIDDNLHTHINVDILKNCAQVDLYDKLYRPDVIIHMAWQDGFNHQSDAHLKNLSAHYEFIRNMIDDGCPNISIMGTMHEVGYWVGEIDENTPCNPQSPYGIAKNALRQAVMAYAENKNVSLKWLRGFYITGDEDHSKNIFGKIKKMADEGQKSFPFTDGKSKFDFEDVNVCAEQIVKAAIQTEINGIINVCSGKAVALKDKVEDFIKKNNLDIKPEYGAYRTRKYDSPEIYGKASLIQQILGRETNENH